jgi:ubiquinone/menaquinone biosynthesis C-methylase UbiE
MSDTEVKEQVRHFYDQVGWQLVGDNQYQNARYEDLRPVSREYIHRCHLRVNRYLKPNGRLLLDAGSGPVQYPEYLTYSQNYQHRVCLDISIVALQEARKRLGDHGLYVVADVAHLPFKSETFDGVVSLHTLHHLPSADQKTAYLDLNRVMAPASTGVIVNGWTDSALMRSTAWMVKLSEWFGKRIAVLRGKQPAEARSKPEKKSVPTSPKDPTGTYIQKLDAGWLRQQIGGVVNYEVRVWRSVNVRFLRAVIHTATGGRYWLRLLYWLEESFPQFMGEKGQYPLIVMKK